MMRQHSRISGLGTAPLEKICEHGLDDVPDDLPLSATTEAGRELTARWCRR
jgi:hypothetical protein